MAISKVILNGEVQMDVTDTTAVAGDVLTDKYFYGADGVKTVGVNSGGSSNIQNSKRYTVQGSGSYTITPDSGKDAMRSVALTVPSISVATPTISSELNPPRIVATVAQGRGYTEGGTTTGTQSCVALGGTKTPTTSEQTLASSGDYAIVTSDLKVAGDANLTAPNIKEGVTIFGVTGTHSGGSTVNVESGKSYTVNGAGNYTISPDTGFDAMDAVALTVPEQTLPTSTSTSASGTSKATISRSTSTRYINIPTGYNGSAAYYQISAVPNGSATGPTSLSASSATVSTGTNTLTLTKTGVTTTPTVSAGYVSSATASTATVALTASVPVQGATTITPTTSDQTIASGTYLSGAQTIKGSGYLTPSNIREGVTIFNVTGTYGGGAVADDKQVFFIDYDGTVVYSYSVSEFAALSALPANPTHSGLTSQGWNWTKAQITAQLAACPNGDVWVGQHYVPSSGNTEIDVTFTDSAYLSPYLSVNVNGSAVVNWGDNTSQTITGTSVTTNQFFSHTYSTTGNYTITISVTGTSAIRFNSNGTAGGGVLRPSAALGSDKIYSRCITAIRLGPNCSISNGGIAGCSNLETVTIPSSMDTITDFPVPACSSLKSFTWPAAVTEIRSSSFRLCVSLKSVSIPPTVTAINSQAFDECHSLTSVTIPTGVTAIKSYAFRGCDAMPKVDMPNTVTTIGMGAFINCRALNSVSLPTSVTSLGDNIFQNSGITSLAIPTGITTIPASMCYGCRQLESLTIPSTVTTVMGSAFRECYSLKSVVFPGNVSGAIGDYWLSDCVSLRTVQFTGSPTCTTLGSNAFRNCSSLQSVTLPNTLTELGNNTFYYNDSLASITIPSGVTSLGSSCFYFCGVSDLHFLSTTPPSATASNTFSNMPGSMIRIFVPTGRLAAYTSATNYPAPSSTVVYIEE